MKFYVFAFVLTICAVAVNASSESYEEPECPPYAVIKFFPNKDNPQEFYQCDWGRAVLKTCAGGTKWSQNLLTCI